MKNIVKYFLFITALMLLLIIMFFINGKNKDHFDKTSELNYWWWVDIP